MRHAVEEKFCIRTLLEGIYLRSASRTARNSQPDEKCLTPIIRGEVDVSPGYRSCRIARLEKVHVYKDSTSGKIAAVHDEHDVHPHVCIYGPSNNVHQTYSSDSRGSG